MMFERRPLKALERELGAIRPDVVGFSLRSIDNSDMQSPEVYYEDLPAAVATVRGLTRALVVLGGGAVAVMPQALLRYSGADLAVLSDGDTVLPQLLGALGRGGDVRTIPRVAWLDGDRMCVAPGRSPTDLNATPAPAFCNWINIRPYLRRFASVPVQTKRGCPFECASPPTRSLRGGTTDSSLLRRWWTPSVPWPGRGCATSNSWTMCSTLPTSTLWPSARASHGRTCPCACRLKT